MDVVSKRDRRKRAARGDSLPSEAPSERVWIEGGLELLRDGGHSAVKLHALATHVGLTTGSFYHHFGGMADYLERLAQAFGDDELLAVLRRSQHDDPQEQLERYWRLHRELRGDELASAMYAWARSYAPAARSVAVAEERVAAFLAETFQRLGSDRLTARAQAALLLSAGAARGAGSVALADQRLRQRMVEIVVAAR
ncbi:MAG: helix-turn-helix domain-containing protein [Acidobacteriota bacterium]